MKEGKGIYYDAHDEWAYKGEFKKDLKDGEGEELYSNGAYFRGFLKSGVKHGQGEYYIPN